MKVDCHIHMLFDGIEWRTAIARHRDKPDEGFARRTLETYRQKGYTYLRDGGDRWGAGACARRLAPEYGIRYTTPLAPLCLKGHYGSFIGLCYEDLREYADLVVSHRKNGADFIKIMVSGIMNFDRFGLLTEEGLPADMIRQLVHIAHEEGMSVMAHCNGARTLEATAAAGVDSVEHGAYGDPESLAALAENNVIWVPTVSTVANLRGKGRHDDGVVTAIFEHFAENLRAFASLGGSIASGSDAGAWQVTHGCDTEDDLLATLGIDPTPGNRAIMGKF